MPLIELALVLLLITAVGGALVRFTPIGLPIFLVIVGAAASLLPGLDRVAVDPDVFLLLFIPLLLFADARVLPRRDLLQVLRPVLLLALGLVMLTVVSVGYFLHWLVPAMPLAVAFTLGAIVSPTDAVATVATTAGLPLPHRVANVVNAESLLNDATASGMPGTSQCRNQPTATTVSATSPSASSSTGRNTCSRSRRGSTRASAKSSGGMKSSRKSSGSMLTACSPGSIEASAPTSTRKMGSPIFVQRTSTPPRAVSRRRIRVSSMTCMGPGRR
jgi:hypothetical protein